MAADGQASRSAWMVGHLRHVGARHSGDPLNKSSASLNRRTFLRTGIHRIRRYGKITESVFQNRTYS